MDDSLIRLKLERGEIPVKGDICVKVNIQSRKLVEPVTEVFELVIDPSESVASLKNIVC